MAMSNRERVSKGLELLATGLRPFFLREMNAELGDDWDTKIDMPGRPGSTETEFRDAYVLLKTMWDSWHQVFGKVLGYTERSLVSELREVRNRWAHQEPFSTDDAYRALDDIQRLLAAVAAPQQEEADQMKQELLRIRYSEQAKRESRRAMQTAIGGAPSEGLRPWRELIKPRNDVATGSYQTTEFAADLYQVYAGTGKAEYRDPIEFFRRTYLTEGLRSLLERAAQRLSDGGGDPVIELQTNFGGGKTHSLLALYHLFSDATVEQLQGVPELLAQAGVTRPDGVRRAVIVGTKISAGQPVTKSDGTVVNTLWGEIAWQLGGKEGYELLAQSDRTATNPGQALDELLKRFAPCMILIDEWVAYARQLYGNPGLPGGTFDTHFTFAQALTESVRATPGALLVVSVPASDGADPSGEEEGSGSAAEIGGIGGFEALKRLKNVIGRMQSPWRPATQDESFEIVRRRLFDDMKDPDAFRARDAVIQGYMDMYASQQAEFPSECREGDYRRRMEQAYPIHPELFERLYTDWSSLERFQRTRGVLRLMASVVHALWIGNDASLLIMPGTVPVSDNAVLSELTQYLEDNWKPIVEKDVDGQSALPFRLDEANPNLGKYSACRRVARTVYLGSAPTVATKHPGLEAKRIELGCVQPGEPLAVFGDALRRLADKSAHLATDGVQYAFTVKPTLNRLAQDRADSLKDAMIEAAIVQTLREMFSGAPRGCFRGVHVAPDGPASVADEPEVRLVVLGPQYPYVPKAETSDALSMARSILDARGTGPRRYRNMLVFVAPDRSLLEPLMLATRLKMAWQSIWEEQEAQNLGPAEVKQVESRLHSATDAVRQRIGETWQWVLLPSQAAPTVPDIKLEPIKVSGDERIAERIAKRLKRDEGIISDMAGVTLRLWLDRIPLWQDQEVSVKQLGEFFAQYLYLPRVVDLDVLLRAVQDGIASLNWKEETFGYAEAFDEASRQYRGLRGGTAASVMASGYVVKPEVFAQTPPGIEVPLSGMPGNAVQPDLWSPDIHDTDVSSAASVAATAHMLASEKLPTRYHGAIALNPLMPGVDAGKVSENVLKYLNQLLGADVVCELEIQAVIPGGVPEDVQRTVLENATTLGFRDSGFEDE